MSSPATEFIIRLSDIINKPPSRLAGTKKNESISFLTHPFTRLPRARLVPWSSGWRDIREGGYHESGGLRQGVSKKKLSYDKL